MLGREKKIHYKYVKNTVKYAVCNSILTGYPSTETGYPSTEPTFWYRLVSLARGGDYLDPALFALPSF